MSEKGKTVPIMRGDIIIICAVLLAAILLGAALLLAETQRDSGAVLEIRTDDGVTRHSLGVDAVIEIESDGYRISVTVASGEAFVSYCNCPDRICARMGRISLVGESIVCVPAHLKLTVVGKGGGDDDAIAG